MPHDERAESKVASAWSQLSSIVGSGVAIGINLKIPGHTRLATQLQLTGGHAMCQWPLR